ncbi:hypothetical protein [Pseudomonas sp. DWRC2-2]|uniref:hypothetical protein n=1 Tax=Pseudomonas sp. DWRC2-2 TaxID=2804567 RepID=UPI003CEC9A4A
MREIDDFRFKSHELLIDLDAATTRIMMLVSAGDMNGHVWDEAVKQHRLAVEKWQALLELSGSAEPA